MSIDKTWNRSSSWSPEVLARLTTATNLSIQSVIEIFNRTFDATTFTDEQRAEVYLLLAEGVTVEMAKFEVNLRPHHVEVEEIFKSK